MNHRLVIFIVILLVKRKNQELNNKKKFHSVLVAMEIFFFVSKNEKLFVYPRDEGKLNEMKKDKM